MVAENLQRAGNSARKAAKPWCRRCVLCPCAWGGRGTCSERWLLPRFYSFTPERVCCTSSPCTTAPGEAPTVDHTALQRVFLAEHGQMCYPAHPQALKVNLGNVTSFPLAFNPLSSVSNRRENEKQDKIKKKKKGDSEKTGDRRKP